MSDQGADWQDTDTADRLFGALNWPVKAPDRANYRMVGLAADDDSVKTREFERGREETAALAVADRAALALEDRLLQQRVFRSLEEIEPQVEMIQRIRALGRFDSTTALAEDLQPDTDMAEWVREALNHYWGGPKLTDSPLMRLRIPK